MGLLKAAQAPANGEKQLAFLRFEDATHFYSCLVTENSISFVGGEKEMHQPGFRFFIFAKDAIRDGSYGVISDCNWNFTNEQIAVSQSCLKTLIEALTEGKTVARAELSKFFQSGIDADLGRRILQMSIAPIDQAQRAASVQVALESA